MNLSVRKALTGILFGAALLPASGTLSAAAPRELDDLLCNLDASFSGPG